MTKAQGKIIAFGLPSLEVFWRELKNGRLSVPYCSCLASDLYLVYRKWCDRAYEKPLTLTKFSCLLTNRETKEKKHLLMDSKHSTYMVYVIDTGIDGDSVQKQCNRFRDSIDIRGVS